ncbi:MAG TPA: cell division protein SepF [Clostridia bacterium]|nr:cell division protein SepF [Clostridia bacterium]
MGMMDKFRSFMGMPDDDDDDDYDYEKESENDYVSHKRVAKEPPVTENPYAGEPEVVKRSNKVVNIAATTQLSVVLVKPERFDDASSIADHLNDKRTVVLNLESTNKEVSRRLVDFLSGVAYANQGQIKRVANSTFIITPYNVDFVGDLLDELENSGVYF